MPIKSLPTLINSSNNPTAAGALFFAKNSCRFLFVFRSPQSIEPNTWCGVGGGIEAGETPEQACRREIKEEIGTVPEDYVLAPALIFDKPGLTFYNYIAIVEKEFEPKLNKENTDYLWVAWEEWPQPLHSGAEALVNDPGTKGMLQYLLQDSRVTAISEIETRERLRLTIRQTKDAAEKRAQVMKRQIQDSLQRDKVGKRK